MKTENQQHLERYTSQTKSIKLASITIEELKYKFKSASKYMPIWNEVKQRGVVTVHPTGGHSCQTIANAIERLKMQDHYFKVASELDLGYQLFLDYRFSSFENETEKDSVTIKLVDRINKLNPINLN
jgi:hypothetical protein